MAKKIVKKAATPKSSTKKVTSKKAAPKKVSKPVKKIATAKKTTSPKIKTAKKTKVKRAPNAAFMKALTPSETLAAVIGTTAIPRTEVVKKMWAYIKKNGLQDKVNKRNINADEKLKPIFGKTQITMFELAKCLTKHLS